MARAQRRAAEICTIERASQAGRWSSRLASGRSIPSTSRAHRKNIVVIPTTVIAAPPTLMSSPAIW
jgi:hypothetical protein